MPNGHDRNLVRLLLAVEGFRVEFLDLLARYPCSGPGSQWAPSDFVEILKEKRSHAISNDDPEITPACGTVVLLISSNPLRGTAG